MAVHVVKVPDIGEGIAEVELVEWHVQPGDTVVADQVLADVMTDKATVEVPSPVAGRVLALGGKAGDKLAVGGDLIRLDVDGARRGRCRRARRLPSPPSDVPTAAGRPPAQPDRPLPPPAGVGNPARAAACAGQAARLAVGPPPRARAGRRSRPGARQRARRTDRPRRPRAARLRRAGAAARRPRATPSATARRPCR